MSDQPQQPSEPPAAPAWHKIPAEMAVLGIPWTYATNVSADGLIWLWIRSPNSCHAWPMDQAAADVIAQGLAGAAAHARALHPPDAPLEVVKAPLLGPNGAPINTTNWTN